MIKLVIVDDEKMIREGLVSTIPWNDFGIKVVGSAEDGKKALDICREHNPHIILTDVRMPKMDGLELLKIIKEEMPGVSVIILSGHDEFNYVQKAIKYGAVDYLIKPVVAEELQNIIMKVKKNLNCEINEDFQRLKINRDLKSELEHFCNAAFAGNKNDALLYLDMIYNKEILNNISIDQHKNLCLHIIDTLADFLKKEGISLGKLESIEINSFDKILVDFTTLEEIKEWIFNLINEVIIFIQDYRNDGYNHVIVKALDYIKNHFKEDMSIEDVANNVCLSTNYFSHIFKKNRGECFTDFLNKLRIEEAKKIFAENIYMVYEVSDMVGFNDYKYFSSIFKKIVGISPTQYCNSIRK